MASKSVKIDENHNIGPRYERKIKPGAKKGRAKLLSMFAPEELTALGPTLEPLYLVVRP
jgi:hypothetical protein